MHCRAWEEPPYSTGILQRYKQIRKAKEAAGCDSDPLSAYYQEPPSTYIQKIRGQIPSSCVQSTTVIISKHADDDMVMKLTATGVTYMHTRRFKKRYSGSATCDVDHAGRLWLNARELTEDTKAEKGKGKDKKKRDGLPPAPKLFQLNRSSELLQISQENSTPESFSPEGEKKIKKKREKSYRVDKVKVPHRIYAYLNTQKGRKQLYFWTVTFPAGATDNACYKAFNTWLTTLRQHNMLKDYLWIAERQTGDRLKDKTKEPTHTIHFHIAIPHFLNVNKANAMMRGILKGYAKKGDMPGAICDPRTKTTYYKPCISRYNGVDIAKHRTTRKPINFAIKKGARSLASYLTKYVTKNDAGVPDENGNIAVPGFTHLAWHCSRGFSRLFTGIACSLAEFRRSGFGFFLNRTRVFKMEFATFVPWLFGPPPLLMQHLYELNSEIQNLFDNEQQKQPGDHRT
jgi:hypothetical protein